ncbi:MAG: VanZ family protein [Ruminococcus sp.]|nr:VanZ family protein [Ruminococcus sp.]
MIAFIFINSALDADTSSKESMGVLQFINNIFSTLNINLTLSENFVRKCAHFVEYFVLGTLLFFTARAFADLQIRKLFVPLCVGFLTACVDETIQLFSFGRSGQFTDVLLDFFGVCTAVFIFYIFTKYSKRKDKEVLN